MLFEMGNITACVQRYQAPFADSECAPKIMAEPPCADASACYSKIIAASSLKIAACLSSYDTGRTLINFYTDFFAWIDHLSELT